MTTGTWVDVDTLRSAIRIEYDEVATHPDKGFHFHVGREAAARLGYPPELTEPIPDSVIESFAGVGNPFSWGALTPGETVVDLGSGAGFDTLLAARMVGETGTTIGIDMTPAMVGKARENAELMGLPRAEFREGFLEELPVDDASVDVVISNGVMNLAPDKDAAFAEAFRVLKPGGRMQISDIVLTRAVPPDAKADIDLWTGWIGGALLEGELHQVIEDAGFTDIRFSTQRYDTFSDAPFAGSASSFGAKGVDIWATKPGG